MMTSVNAAASLRLVLGHWIAGESNVTCSCLVRQDLQDSLYLSEALDGNNPAAVMDDAHPRLTALPTYAPERAALLQ